MNQIKNPCLACGSCCAFFRVSFYWGENETTTKTSEILTEKITHHMVAMKGTNAYPPRCVALLGEIGHSVSCSHYENRPSPCRNFSYSWDNDIQNNDCDRARNANGLLALVRKT